MSQLLLSLPDVFNLDRESPTAGTVGSLWDITQAVPSPGLYLVQQVKTTFDTLEYGNCMVLHVYEPSDQLRKEYKVIGVVAESIDKVIWYRNLSAGNQSDVYRLLSPRPLSLAVQPEPEPEPKDEPNVAYYVFK